MRSILCDWLSLSIELVLSQESSLSFLKWKCNKWTSQMAAKESLAKFEFNMEFHWHCVTSYSDGQSIFFFLHFIQYFLKNRFFRKAISIQLLIYWPHIWHIRKPKFWPQFFTKIYIYLLVWLFVLVILNQKYQRKAEHSFSHLNWDPIMLAYTHIHIPFQFCPSMYK